MYLGFGVVSMSSAISRIECLLRSKARLFYALTTLLFIILPTEIFAGVYPGSPVFRCKTGIGCCTPASVNQIVSDAIKGGGAFVGIDLQKSYYTDSLWPKIEKAIQQLTDEMRNVSSLSAAAPGPMIDAQNMTKTLTSLQKQNTSSLISQTPSDQICRFGTLSKSLAQSDDKRRIVQLGLSSQMMKRQLMHMNMASALEAGVGNQLGRTADKESRFNQYKETFCDPKDSNGTLGDGWCTGTTDTRQNRDIEITRTLINPQTLKLDFSSNAEIANMTTDEENLFALANNLFAHNLPLNMGKNDFQDMMGSNDTGADSQKEQLMDYRSLTAKRNVAQNSFAALAAMKAEGSAGVSTYLKAMAAELGLDAANQDALIGDKPSYNAQMEFLTRKLYQSPSFYANLMESNPNVARQQTAMEAIALMQDRDIYESLRRSEMVLSTLLEMYVSREQDSFKDRGAK